MEVFQENPSKLTVACRGCLGIFEGAKSLDEDEALISKFEAVACLKVVINEKLPSYLCENCEEKTNDAYTFQEICQKSDKFAKNLLGIDETERPPKPIKKEKNSETLICEVCHKSYTSERFFKKHMLSHNQPQRKTKNPVNNIEKIEIFDDEDSIFDNDDDLDAEFDVPEYIKIECEDKDHTFQLRRKSKKKLRRVSVSNFNFDPPRIKLKQFSKANVDSVIESVKSKLQSQQGCPLCEFHALNWRSLSHHICMAHKEEKANWCSACNKIVENLTEHTAEHSKELECPFCQKTMKNHNQFIEHVGRHAAHHNFNCTLCEEAFSKHASLKKHLFEVHSDVVSRKMEKEIKLKKRLKIGLSRNPRVRQVSQEQVEGVVKRVQAKMNATANCPVCQFQAVNSRALSTHMGIIHKDEKPNWCYFCNELNIKNMAEHKKEMHAKEYACDFCHRNHKNVTNFIEHLRRHSDFKGFSCRHCKKSFINEKYLEKHVKLHEEVQILVEADNNSSDDDVKLSKLVVKKDSNDVAKAADDPTKENKEEVDVEEIKVEIGESQLVESPSHPPNFCQVCRKTVTNLKRHCKRRHGTTDPEPPSLCPQCGKMFKDRGKLNMHMRQHAGIQPYKCQFCTKAFFMNSHLKLHIRTHTKEKPYICQVCGKSFAQTSMLSTHMRIHTGRPEQCAICEQRFCRPSELRIHMRKHTGEKPYICDQCGRGFKQTSHLSDHRRTHFDERPFQCSFCDKAFKNVATLKAHEFIHTGTKPFKCSKCAFTCRVSYHLTKHMMTHDGDKPMRNKPYSCEICTKNFQTKAHLYSHFDRYHNSSQNQEIQEIEQVVIEELPQDEKMGTEVAFYA